MRVTTRSGRSVTATLAKSFLTLREGRVVPIDGKDLVVGDVLPVNRCLPLWNLNDTIGHQDAKHDGNGDDDDDENKGASKGSDEMIAVSQSASTGSSLFAALRSGCRKRARRCLDAVFAGRDRGEGIASPADPVETDLIMALASLAGGDEAVTADGARVLLGRALLLMHRPTAPTARPTHVWATFFGTRSSGSTLCLTTGATMSMISRSNTTPIFPC